MSQEDIDAVRQGYEHFNRTGQIDFSNFAPEAEFDATGRAFDRDVYRGREQIGEFFSQLSEVWQRQLLEPQEFLETADEVVVPLKITTVGKGSGVETVSDAAHVWTLCDQKVIRLQIFQTRNEALEAAGLSE